MEQKRREEKQKFKKEGQARSMSGYLKKGELEPPYELLTMCAISSKLAIKILGRRQRL